MVRRVALGLAVLTLLATVPAIAQQSEPEGGPLRPGSWTATGIAHGTATAAEQGATIDWVGQVDADFDFQVTDGGRSSGTWGLEGLANLTLEASAQGLTVGAHSFLDYAGGGTVSGTDHVLELGGAVTTEALTVTDVGQFETTDTQTVPPMLLRVDATVCDEAYGSWAFTVKNALEDAGFDASIDGTWMALLDTDQITREVADALAAAHVSGEHAPAIASDNPLLFAVASLLREYNDFVARWPTWSWDEIEDLLTRSEGLINELRNLSECDNRLYGEENVEVFLGGLTLVIQALITTPAEGELHSFYWQMLAHIGMRTGAFGPGAYNPALAVEAEQSLIDAAELILDANVDPSDRHILVNEDTLRVMTTGAAMGWVFFVPSAGAGYAPEATTGVVDPRFVLENYSGSAP